MQTTKCRKCSKEIIFLLTEKGKRMPVDFVGVINSDEMYDKHKHISHFSTCSDPQEFRKGKSVKK